MKGLALTEHLKHFSVGHKVFTFLNTPLAPDLQQFSKTRSVKKPNLQISGLSRVNDFALWDLNLPDVELPVIWATEVVIRSVHPPTRPTATTFFGRKKRQSRQHSGRRPTLQQI